MPKNISYGTWSSPITSESLVQESIGLGDIFTNGEQSYWLEMRPSEDGRYVLVTMNNKNEVVDLTPAPYNVRSRVHEYGGGAFTLSKDSIYFSNFTDQRIYKMEGDSENIFPISSDNDNYRYADFKIHENLNWLIAVKESHHHDMEPSNSLVAIDCNGSYLEKTLASGADFYSSPVTSPDETKLAWIQWNHPNMPWDSISITVRR